MRTSAFSPKAALSAAVIVFAFAACSNDENPGPAPVITSFYATSGVVGSPVTIIGDQFIPEVPPAQGKGSFPNTSVITFNGITAIAESVYQDSIGKQHINTIVPAGATSGKIAVSANGITVSSADDFTVIVPAYLPNVQVTTLLGWGTDIAMDNQGILYATHKDAREIVKIKPDGVSQKLWSSASEIPFGIAVDPGGNVFSTVDVVRVLKISADGQATPLAGGSVSGYADGQGANARFSIALGVGSDKDGNVYVADLLNYKIRKITPDGTVSTVAGSTRGHKDGAGTNAQFEEPIDVAADGGGNLYVADRHRIRKISGSGQVTTVAGSIQGYMDGTTTSALFNNPQGIVIDQAGNLYICDYGNYVVRRIAKNGAVTTVAGTTYGSKDGPGSAAQFFGLLGMTMSSSGVLYVAQSDGPLRKIVIQ